MELAARRFIIRILLLHLALLLVVSLIVGAAARTIHHTARDQALAQAQATQELLARQTSRGIQNYYKSITAVLELLKPTQEDEVGASTQPVNQNVAAAGGGGGAPLGALLGGGGLPFPRGPFGEHPTDRPFDRPTDRPTNNPRGGESNSMRKRVIEALWTQLQERVSLLFILEARPPAHQPGHMVPTTAPAFHFATRDAFGEENGLNADAVNQVMGDWLGRVESASISDFQVIQNVRCNVVAVPMRTGPGGKRMLVAVVPIDRIERDLLANVNARATTGAMLVDENGTVMSHSLPQVIGTNVNTDFHSGHAREVAARYRTGNVGGTEIFNEATTVGTTSLSPGMVTIEPIIFEQFGDKRWWVSIASGMENINAVVNNLFHEAFIWAIFLVISVTAILFSTSMQLIRARLRMERVRHELLERELSQAREIQLHWLPNEPYNGPHAAVAAVNRPASRISGDFYNWFDLPDGRTAVVIGDVTGHGMAAAFLMSTTQLLVRNTLLRCGEPGRCLADVNRQLCTQVFNGQFVTMLLLTIDPDRRHIDLANAGHPAPLICDCNGFRKLEVEPQLVLGVDRDTEYPTQRIDLATIAQMLLFTDGVVDATNNTGKRFRLDGLLSCLGAGSSAGADSLLSTVTTAVDRFRQGQDLADDLTLVAIDFQLTPTPGREPLAVQSA